jgi:hypothetical protein
MIELSTNQKTNKTKVYEGTFIRTFEGTFVDTNERMYIEWNESKVRICNNIKNNKYLRMYVRSKVRVIYISFEGIYDITYIHLIVIE